MGVFVFRRDLRLDDNRGLARVLASSGSSGVIPVFVLDPHQVRRATHNRWYFSKHSLQFMCESLRDLDRDLRQRYGVPLRLLYGNPTRVLPKLIRELRQTQNPVVVGWNRDWSPYAQRRDADIERACVRLGASVVLSDDDDTLCDPRVLLKADGSAYVRFGAFARNACLHAVPLPVPCDHLAQFVPSSADYDQLDDLYAPMNPRLAQRGGRTRALATLRGTRESATALDGGAHVSAALNFGCVSVREAFHAFREEHRRSLWWRDFYGLVVRHVPGAGDPTRHIDARFDAQTFPWKNDPGEWKMLTESRTGFLLVDAGMRQMRETGFVPNRVRMILAVMWTKYLRIDSMHPKYGSQVGFSRYLVDAVGPSQNLMNHRWVLDFDDAGRKYAPRDARLSGRPMDVSNRILRRWDPRGEYVHRWLPELRDVPIRDLVRWSASVADRYGRPHPPPMFDARERYNEWIEGCRGL